MGVMRLYDVRVESSGVTEKTRRERNYLYERVDSEREVGCGQQRSALPGDPFRDRWQLAIPASRADNDRTSGRDRRAHIARCRVRLRELDRDVGAGERRRRDSRAISIGGAADSRDDVPSPLGCELLDRAPHLPHADERELAAIAHAAAPSPKNSSCSRRITGFTCSPSTTIVRLIPVALSESMWIRVSRRARRARAMCSP